jgi:tRNA 2-thiouridine synthesizing protein E
MTPGYPANAVRQQNEVHHLANLKYWSLIIAYGLAAAEGIKLSQEHIEVLYWLRAEYDQSGCFETKHLLQKLENDFELKDGKQYLESLFPGEPVTQWLRIAGLPV